MRIRTDKQRRRDLTVALRHHDTGLKVSAKGDNRRKRYAAKRALA